MAGGEEEGAALTTELLGPARDYNLGRSNVRSVCGVQVVDPQQVCTGLIKVVHGQYSKPGGERKPVWDAGLPQLRVAELWRLRELKINIR